MIKLEYFSGGQFLKWQTISHTAEATDVSVIALGDGEVAIVIVLQVKRIFDLFFKISLVLYLFRNCLNS